MSWARFDDHFDDDPDCDIVGPEAACLFICSITWSSRNETDGFIPCARAAKLMGCSPDAIDRLTQEAVRWWVEVPGGWQVRNYLKYNPSRAELEAQRAAKVEAGRKGGEKSGEVRRRNLSEASAQPSFEALASPPAIASAIAQPIARPQAKTKPESRLPDSDSRTPSPESRVPKHTDPPAPREGPPGNAPPGERAEVCVDVFENLMRILADDAHCDALLAKHGLEAVRWQMLALDWRIGRGKFIGDPAAYLLNAIEKDIPLPAEVRFQREMDADAEKALRARAAESAALSAAQARKSAERDLDDAWDALPDEERARIERDAVAFASQNPALKRQAAKLRDGDMARAGPALAGAIKAFRNAALIERGKVETKCEGS